MWTKAKDKAKRVVSKMGSSSSRRSRESASSRDTMSVDSQRDTRSQGSDAQEEVPRSRLRIRIMTRIEQIVPRSEAEAEKLRKLQDRSYGHAKYLDAQLLIKTGLGRDMEYAMGNAGWHNFYPVHEKGSHFLTMEFLMTLNVEVTPKETKIHFRLFNEEFELSPKKLSEALGFSKKCLTSPERLVSNYRYNRAQWWDTITGEPLGGKNSITSIHNPTIRFLAKWIAMVVHPRADLRLCLSSDTECLFALVRKIWYSPVMSMLDDWQRLVTSRATIDVTSLVTRIAENLGLLKNAQVTYLPVTPEYQQCISLDHFVQGHLMREGPGHTLFMLYPGFIDEVELPCPGLALSTVKSLTLALRRKEPPRHSVAGPVTRGRAARQEEEEAGTSSQQQQQQEFQGHVPQPQQYQEYGYYPHHQQYPQYPGDPAHMSFEQAYDHYQGMPADPQVGPSSSYGQQAGPSHGPQVGPSTSARFGYENPIYREFSNIQTQLDEIQSQQEIFGETLDHNTNLTQQTWGATSAIQYDLVTLIREMNINPNEYQPPRQQ
jgi:hypothetical protein